MSFMVAAGEKFPISEISLEVTWWVDINANQLINTTRQRTDKTKPLRWITWWLYVFYATETKSGQVLNDTLISCHLLRDLGCVIWNTVTRWTIQERLWSQWATVGQNTRQNPIEISAIATAPWYPRKYVAAFGSVVPVITLIVWVIESPVVTMNVVVRIKNRNRKVGNGSCAVIARRATGRVEAFKRTRNHATGSLIQTLNHYHQRCWTRNKLQAVQRADRYDHLANGTATWDTSNEDRHHPGP